MYVFIIFRAKSGFKKKKKEKKKLGNTIIQWCFEKRYCYFILFFFPPLCVFCYKFLGGKQVSLYLLQHDKSISHGADTGLVETKWAQENRKI